MIELKELKAIVKEYIAPVLRDYGFQGSGLSFRRITVNHYIHAITIQPHPRGGSYCMDLGVYIDILPGMWDFVKPETVTSVYCEIQSRLTPDGRDYWLDYGMNIDDALRNSNEILSVFKINGLSYFEQYTNFPEPLESLTVKDLNMKKAKYKMLFPFITEIRLALLLARLHLYLGNIEKSKQFCDFGLKGIQKDVRKGYGSSLVDVFESIRIGQMK